MQPGATSVASILQITLSPLNPFYFHFSTIHSRFVRVNTVHCFVCCDEHDRTHGGPIDEAVCEMLTAPSSAAFTGGRCATLSWAVAASSRCDPSVCCWLVGQSPACQAGQALVLCKGTTKLAGHHGMLRSAPENGFAEIAVGQQHLPSVSALFALARNAWRHTRALLPNCFEAWQPTACAFISQASSNFAQGRRVLLNLYEVLTNDPRFKGDDSGPASFCPEHWLGDDAGGRAGAWCGAQSPKSRRAATGNAHRALAV